MISETACRVHDGEQQRPVVQLGAVEDRVVLEHRLVVLREQVAPVLGPGAVGDVTASRPRGASRSVET